MQGLVHVLPQLGLQKLPLGHWSLLVHGVLMSQQEFLSQQADAPPTAPVQVHGPCPSMSFGHWLSNGSQAQAPCTQTPIGLQHWLLFVPALHTAPPLRLH